MNIDTNIYNDVCLFIDDKIKNEILNYIENIFKNKKVKINIDLEEEIFGNDVSTIIDSDDENV